MDNFRLVNPYKMKHIEVVAAIIVYDNKILCVQRGESKLSYISKKYEFPGGKMELGERKEDTIKREILEELKMEIDVKDEFLTVQHQYPDFMLEMHSFICHCKDNTVTLTEHLDFKWLSISELNSLDWAAADIPIVQKLING
jgi:8-oxo-dGTP diphosphatase